jgi:signal transduction histidine kinase
MINFKQLANESVGHHENEFLSMASHELKTPITGLKLQAEMAKRAIEKLGPDALSPERVKKLVDNFHYDINRLKRLVDDILDVSRITSGKLTMRMEIINVEVLLLEIVDRMTQSFTQFNHLVDVKINTPINMTLDPHRIEQVITNLISNAIRYGNGSPIKFYIFTHSKSLFISVSDKGPGISDENQKSLFDRFKKKKIKIENEGLGLGLYITNEIVRAHKGQIHLESHFGEGSNFTVEIPFIQQ